MKFTWREDWFNESRLTLYPKVFFAMYLVLAIAWVMLSKDLVDRADKPLGYDFITFWAASDLALQGRSVDAFDIFKIFASQQKAVPANQAVFLWHYPPVFLLVALPLALLPYLLSYAVWMLATFALFAAGMRRLIPVQHGFWLMLAFPATFLNIMHGQNGFLTAVLIAGACLTLERRPILAGILIGALCYKPHFGLLFPLILVAGRYWVPLAVAAVTTLVLCGAATLVFGVENWIAFWNNLPVTRVVLETGKLPWHKMPTIFAMASKLGADVTLAYVAQFAVAATVTVVTVRAWYRRAGSLELRSALLAVALLLISPYGFDYDLVILAVPILLLLADGMRNGWMPGMRTMLAAVWVMPLALPGLAEHSPFQLMPLVLLAFFGAICVRIGIAARTEPALAAQGGDARA
jgi:hypothetical protein